MTFNGNITTTRNAQVATFVLCLFALVLVSIPEVAYAENIIDSIKQGTLSVVLAPVAGMALVILTIANWFFFLVGALFNWVVVELVFEFAQTIGNAPGILIAWGILRDLGNILLLFGFVFMGFATILNLHDYPIKKTIPRLIIFAVLLNFSLFIAEAIIDTSNIFASSLYQSQAQPCTGGSVALCALNNGLTASVVQATGMNTIFQADLGGVQAGFADYFEDPLHQTTLLLGLAMFVMTAAVVLFSAAILLIARAVMLGFLMVTAPIGFVGFAVPFLSKMAKDWWTALIHNAFFAPVFFLLLFVALKIAQGLSAAIGNSGGLAAALTADNVTSMGAVVIFCVVIGFMIAALIIAKQFGVYGADAVVKNATTFIGKTAGFASFGTAAYVPRRIIGGTAERTSRFMRRTGLSTIPIGREFTRVADYGATASFDARGLGAFGSTLGKTGDLSKGTKKGARGVAEAAAKQRVKEAKEVREEREKWSTQRALEAERIWPQKLIDNTRDSKAKDRLERDKAAFIGKTREQFLDKDQKDRLANLELELAKAVQALADAQSRGDQKAITAQEGKKSKIESQIDKLAESGEFERKYMERMGEMADVLGGIGYDVRGMQLAAVDIRKELRKSPEKKVLDELKKVVKAQGDDAHAAPAAAPPPPSSSGGSGGGGGGGGGGHH